MIPALPIGTVTQPAMIAQAVGVTRSGCSRQVPGFVVQAKGNSSADHIWRYAIRQNLPEIGAIKAGLRSMRRPLPFSICDCTLIAHDVTLVAEGDRA